MGKGKNVFPAPKKGKWRTAKKFAMKACRKMYQRVPYVRHGRIFGKSRPERTTWSRSLSDFLNRGDKHTIDVLKKDKVLPEWKNKRCPWCKIGELGPLKKYTVKQGGWAHRCKRRQCDRRVPVHAFHPVFVTGGGQNASGLQEQATALFCAVSGVSQVSAQRICGRNHKMVEGVFGRLRDARRKYVLAKEKTIKFGKGENWKDVEADELDLGKGEDPDASPSYRKPTVWEQWGGIVERGAPETLVLFRLNPRPTKRRSPGPGPISKRDWTPVGEKWLAGRRVILHTDGARTYKMKLKDVIHDWVVHKKKRVVVGGKQKWVKPHYTKVRYHNIKEEGSRPRKLWVKCGTQIIDRAWSS